MWSCRELGIVGKNRHLNCVYTQSWRGAGGGGEGWKIKFSCYHACYYILSQLMWQMYILSEAAVVGSYDKFRCLSNRWSDLLSIKWISATLQRQVTGEGMVKAMGPIISVWLDIVHVNADHRKFSHFIASYFRFMFLGMPLSSPNQLFCGTVWRGYVCRLPIGPCWLGVPLLVLHTATCSMWVSDSQFWPIFCDYTTGVMPWPVWNLRD